MFNKVSLCSFIKVFTLALFGTAQQIYGQTAYGYSSLEWDEPSSTIFGYSETDLDANSAFYYEAYVQVRIYDHNNRQIATGGAADTDNLGEIDITVSAPGPHDTYTLVGTHKGLVNYSYEDGCDNASSVKPNLGPGVPAIINPCGYRYYDDFYNFSTFDEQAQSLYDYFWFGPGPAHNTRASLIQLGSTFDVLTVTTSNGCGDDRDQLIQQYKTYHVAFYPTCSAFTRGLNTSYFTWDELNYPSPMTAPAQFSDHAVFTWQALGFVNAWYSLATFAINSGYRDPYQNSLAGGAGNSRHMFGVAFDARNDGTVAGWNKLYFTAATAGADWREPRNGPCKLGCMHGDVRTHPASYVNP